MKFDVVRLKFVSRLIFADKHVLRKFIGLAYAKIEKLQA